MAPKLSSKIDWKATSRRFRPDSTATPRHNDTAIPPKLAWGPILIDFCSLLCLIFDSRIGGTGRQAFPIKCVADHFGGFRAWIPERSDFFKGPKGPKGPLGPLLTVLIKLLFKDILYKKGAQGAFGPLKKVASLRDPCPESPKMVGYGFYFMPRTSQTFFAFPGMK